MLIVADETDQHAIEEAQSLETDLETTPSNTRPTPYVCDYDGCGRAFSRPCRLEEHIRSHTGERPFVCDEPDCGKTFQRDYHLSRHKRDSHAGIRNHACSWKGCDKRFATSQRLRSHEQSHVKKTEYQCKDFPPCVESFRKRSTLQAHISEVHMGQKAYQCAFTDPVTGQPCQKGYNTQQNLNHHISSCHSGTRYACTICSSTASTSFTTDSSVADPSSPGTSMSSSSSVVDFPTLQLYQLHMKEHHPPPCPHCKLVVQNLGLHIKRQHPELSPAPPEPTFDCHRADCSASFNTKANLNAHVRAVHEKQKRFVCGQTDMNKSTKLKGVDGHPMWNGKGCGEGFTYKSLLEEHIRVHHLGLPKKPGRMARRIEDENKMEPRPAVRLLGFDGVDDEPVHAVECLSRGCEEMFLCDEDMEAHCATRHGMTESEIVDALREREALAGGTFWVGGIDPKLERGQRFMDEEQAWFNPSDAVDATLVDPELI